MAVSKQAAPHEEQVGDVDAGNQEHQPGNCHEEKQIHLEVALQVGHIATPGCEHDVLFAEL